MNAASSFAFPGSRTLAGWWRQLAPYQPLTLWVAHLFFHRVEALVTLTRPCRPDRFTLLVLRALEMEERLSPLSPQGRGVGGEGEERLEVSTPSPPTPLPPGRGEKPPDLLARLDTRLHLGRPLLRQLMRLLANEGLVRAENNGCWALTGLGRKALEAGEYPRASQERRVFHFRDPRAAGGPGRGELSFVHLRGGAVPWAAGEDWQFQLDALHACVAQSVEWKQQHGFPAEVSEVVGSAAAGEAAWQQVIVDRPERLLAALVRPAADPSRLLGFAVRQDGWHLQSQEPVLIVPGQASEQFPELAEDPPLGAWQQAWQAWCQTRQAPPAEVEQCTLELHDAQLRVSVPPGMRERFRETRSDVLRGEVWLLAGDGPIRRAAVVEIASS